jgi:hypothetical protein
MSERGVSMRQYIPYPLRYLLLNLLSSIVGGGIIFFCISLVSTMTLDEYFTKLLGLVIGYNLAAIVHYERLWIKIQDGQIMGPARWWRKRPSFSVTQIDWSKSVPVIGWKRWFKNEYIVSTDGDKIVISDTFTKQQRESLWQALQQAQTDVGN